jgi:hypothetical protein
MVKGEWDVINLTVGLLAAIGFFFWGYLLDGGVKDE